MRRRDNVTEYDATPILIGRGLAFAEGVNFDRDGVLYCVDVAGGGIWRRPPNGELREWVHTSGGPNGSRFGPDGDLFVADCGRREILRVVTSTAAIATYAADCQGEPFRGPNDLCFGPDGTLYFTFSTGGGIQIRTSTNMKTWSYEGTVFDAVPSWVTDAVDPITDLWAPDVSYVDGLYHLYYVGSQFGTNTSVIGLATNTTLDPSSPRYRWVDRGEVISSTTSDNWNAIDPNLVMDATHRPWLVFGSFWGGIKLRRLDVRTGKLSHADPTLYSLAYRSGSNAIEAPFIVHRGRYYYLFVSFDFCCRGAQSTYRIMVGRSRRLTGPYVAKGGASMMDGAATQTLASHGRYRGPGGQAIYVDGATYWLVYHYYDAATTTPLLRRRYYDAATTTPLLRRRGQRRLQAGYPAATLDARWLAVRGPAGRRVARPRLL